MSTGRNESIPEGPTDKSLMFRLRDGEEDAATRLYMRYAKRLEAFTRRQTSDKLAARFDPEDVIQSVFRTFFRRASEGSFDVPAGEELWQLLLVIALNKIRKLGRYHTSEKRNVDRTTGGDSLQAIERESDGLELKMLQLVVSESLEQFPEMQRQMIELRIRDYSIVEIADMTKRSRRTVERVLKQFREIISEYINDHVDD